ncbi:MAG: DinB family protein [Bacteroidia bacterium]
MTETHRINKLFTDLYNGNPWIDVTIDETLKNITAVQAAKKVSMQLNSIWEIVNHIISWRENVLQRVQGSVINTPDDNYFTLVKDTSEAEWENTLKKLKVSQQKWISFIENFNEINFEKIYPKNNMTYYEHIQGLLQHDAYHLGQIVLIKKLL